jgi:uncharacterized membrane protein YfcA
LYNLLIGICFIIGGASGQYALRGTNSTIGLMVFGALLCVWGIYQMSSAKSAPTGGTRSTRRTGTSRTGNPRGTGRAPAGRNRQRR